MNIKSHFLVLGLTLILAIFFGLNYPNILPPKMIIDPTITEQFNCPTGMKLVKGNEKIKSYCIDSVSRPKLTKEEATQECRKEQLEVCNTEEWTLACEQKIIQNPRTEKEMISDGVFHSFDNLSLQIQDVKGCDKSIYNTPVYSYKYRCCKVRS